MKYENNKVRDLNIAYIGGGSRGWAWTFMTDLSMDDSLSGTIRLYDIDEEAAKHNEIIGNHLTERPDTIGKWNYTTCKTIGDALTGADFVVISILPGTFDEMESDVHLPERLGIYQSVGDTAGPGGIIRALRTLPMFVDIANAIKEYCPKAWVINYTNPMTLCVKVLYHTFPEIKAFGCCHEVFGTQKVLKGICEEVTGIKDIDRRDIMVNVLGINHFTWFDQASYKGSIQDWASTYPLFHWGPIPWSFYLVLASAFGFMLHVRKCDKQKYSEACRPLLGRRVDGFWGKLIDLLAVFALLAGTATTFSLATPLLSMAISHVFHIPASNLLTIGLLAIIGITYTIAVYFGMKGVSKLASSCTYLFFALLLYVLIGG